MVTRTCRTNRNCGNAPPAGPPEALAARLLELSPPGGADVVVVRCGPEGVLVARRGTGEQVEAYQVRRCCEVAGWDSGRGPVRLLVAVRGTGGQAGAELQAEAYRVSGDGLNGGDGGSASVVVVWCGPGGVLVARRGAGAEGQQQVEAYRVRRRWGPVSCRRSGGGGVRPRGRTSGSPGD